MSSVQSVRLLVFATASRADAKYKYGSKTAKRWFSVTTWFSPPSFTSSANGHCYMREHAYQFICCSKRLTYALCIQKVEHTSTPALHHCHYECTENYERNWQCTGWMASWTQTLSILDSDFIMQFEESMTSSSELNIRGPSNQYGVPTLWVNHLSNHSLDTQSAYGVEAGLVACAVSMGHTAVGNWASRASYTSRCLARSPVSLARATRPSHATTSHPSLAILPRRTASLPATATPIPAPAIYARDQVSAHNRCFVTHSSFTFVICLLISRLSCCGLYRERCFPSL